MLPIIELRGAIPYAAGMGIPWPKAYLLAVTGNLVPVVPLLLFLGPVSEFLRRLPAFGKFFDWLFARTRKRTRAVEKYGPWGLALFVAMPLARDRGVDRSRGRLSPGNSDSDVRSPPLPRGYCWRAWW